MINEDKLMKDILNSKITGIQRLIKHLQYSRQKINWPLTSTSELSENEMESLSAFNERFAKLQDLSASAMKQALLNRGENPLNMGDVLLQMEKNLVISSLEDWKEMRDFRNSAAHDYYTDGDVQAKHFNLLNTVSDRLILTAENLIQWCRNHNLTQ